MIKDGMPSHCLLPAFVKGGWVGQQEEGMSFFKLYCQVEDFTHSLPGLGPRACVREMKYDLLLPLVLLNIWKAQAYSITFYSEQFIFLNHKNTWDWSALP